MKKEKFFFDDIFEDWTKLGKKVLKSKYLVDGKYPVIDQGKNKIAGFTNEEKKLFLEIPVIIFGDHTRILKFIDFPFFLGADGVKILKNKRKNFLDKYLYYALKYFKIPDTGYNRHFKWLKDFFVIDLEIEKQEKVIGVLDEIQKILKSKKEQLSEFEKLSKCLFFEMFGDPVLNEKRWDRKKLKEECEIITGNTPFRGEKKYYGKYIEWIKSDNIVSFTPYPTKAKEFLSEIGLKKARSLECDNILMTCIAGSINSIGNVSVTNRDVTFNQQINGIKIQKNNVWFMFKQFEISKKYIQGAITMSLKGILSKSKLGELYFIFPKIELQNKFAERIKLIEKSKFALSKSLKFQLECTFLKQF